MSSVTLCHRNFNWHCLSDCSVSTSKDLDSNSCNTVGVKGGGKPILVSMSPNILSKPIS